MILSKKCGQISRIDASIPFPQVLIISLMLPYMERRLIQSVGFMNDE